MKNISKIIAAVMFAAALASGGTAMARGGGGGHGGGGGGFHGGGGGFHGGGGGFHGGGFHGGGWGRGGWGYGGWGYGGWDYPDWDYGYAYGYPGYYPDYSTAPAPYDYPPGVSYAPDQAPPPNSSARQVSPYCATPARVCVLHRPGYVGGACACRVAGGYSHGRVAPQ